MIDDREDVVNDFINAGGKAILHTDSVNTINQLKEMLVGKLNKMLDVLDHKQTTSRKQLRHKMAG